MKFDLAKAVFCGIVLLGEALAAEGSGTYHITMEGAAPYYTPVVATVPAGYRIQWNNKTATVHNVTHDGCLTGEACAFDSGAVASGNSFSLSLLQPGTYLLPSAPHHAGSYNSAKRPSRNRPSP